MLTHNNPDKYRPALDAAQAHNAALTRENAALRETLRTLCDAADDYLTWHDKDGNLTSTVLRAAIRKACEVL